MKHSFLHAGLLVSALILSASSAMAAVTFDWAVIGSAGNVADNTGYGAVGYEYSIATTEVTTAQYVEFLNAVAATDTYGLYNEYMGAAKDTGTDYYNGILRTGSSGSYEYSANTGWADRPVVYVSWYDTLRFVNWLNNGQLSGSQDASTTEDGAYTFSGATSVSTRNTGADYWLPSENEWYKAAYYDPILSLYYDYATSNNAIPEAGVDANYWVDLNGDAIRQNNECVLGDPYYSTPVGYYDNDSPYGTYDQSGNVWEWNETLIQEIPDMRGMRGGAWTGLSGTLGALNRTMYSPLDDSTNVGFRIASSFTGMDGVTIPEPASVGLVLLSLGGLVARRRKRS